MKMINLEQSNFFGMKRLLRLSGVTGRAVFSALLVALFMLSSCGKDPAEPGPGPDPDPDPDPDPTPTVVEYLQFNTKSASGLTIELKAENTYQLTTTNQDPYINTEPLKNDTHADSTVLTFEYTASAEVNFLQLFFQPVSEKRSMKTKPLEKSARWKKWSVNVKEQMTAFQWGKAGSALRVDVGDVSGITLQIRNMRFRAMTEEEKKEAEEEEAAKDKDKRMETQISEYLDKSFTSKVTNVTATSTKVTIAGNYTGEGNFDLCEVPPYLDITEVSKFNMKTPLTSKSFSVDLDRFVERDGVTYDRILSKWVIAKEGETKDAIVSHARYLDQIPPVQSTVEMKPTSKKGLGGFFKNQFESDLDDLGITSVTVNVPITAWMHLTSTGNSYSHPYGGKTYYFDKGGVNNLDQALKAAKQRNIVVAAIILIQKAKDCPDPEVGRLLQHPDYTSNGIYSMPNMTNPASVQCYAAALDFLATRYCKNAASNGRIHHWIMHNEVDIGYGWTNMGEKPMMVYTDAYMKSMRMCYNIARQYDQYTEVFGSFAHSWAKALDAMSYPTQSMLQAFNKYSKAEGDFRWAVAYHSYPQDLNEPKTWLDKEATFSMKTAIVSFKNLEVIDKWINKSENKYQGDLKRSLWLSENGTNSRSYSKLHLEEQAAGFAYAWKKIDKLSGIDGIQWHNWIDNSTEDGLKIGLRKFPEEGAGKKLVWFAYEAADTDQEDTVFEPYRSIVGVAKWDDIHQPFIVE